MKNLDDLTRDELQTLVNDLHALMWYGDGCEICAHKIVEQREPYTKLGCALMNGCATECRPLWRGFEGTPHESGEIGF